MSQVSDDERLPSAPGQRACDECRHRKIRCDRKRPCTHCRAASLSCRTTVTRPEQKSRVMVSKQYENKIDRMESQLASIEQLLRNLSKQPSATIATTTTTTQTLESPHGGSQISDHLRNLTHNVGTGPHADFGAAKELFEKTVGSSAKVQQSVAEALQALQGIVGRLDADAEMSYTTVLPKIPIDVVPPPWPQVAPILQKAGEPGAGVANWAFPFASISDFTQKSRRLYEQHHNDIPSRRLSVYAGLFGLCCEFSALESGSEDRLEHAKYYYDLSQVFEPLVLRTATELPMVLPPSKESVEALVSGSIVLVNMCKPSLASTLASAAIGMCQTLGYHRLSSMIDDPEEMKTSKMLLFWFSYTQDRSLSLRLGRAPCFKDSYISLPKPTSSTLIPQLLLPLLDFWIDSAVVQGEICERLYSPAAATQPIEQRSQAAQELADNMQILWNTRHKSDAAVLRYFKEHSGSIARLMSIGDEVSYLGTMALVLHASAPTSDSPSLHYARKFLEAIRDTANTHCKNAYNWMVYCHWVLLNCPLTPFTIMFCEVITHYQNSQADLQLMRSYVASLHPACQLSSGVQKLYDLCSVFLRVAEAYTASKLAEESSQPGPSEDNVLVTGEFDEYLASLGLAPFPQMNNVSNEPDMSAYLQDWYTGNASLYGMLDMGIPGMDMSGMEGAAGMYQ